MIKSNYFIIVAKNYIPYALFYSQRDTFINFMHTIAIYIYNINIIYQDKKTDKRHNNLYLSVR